MLVLLPPLGCENAVELPPFSDSFTTSAALVFVEMALARFPSVEHLVDFSGLRAFLSHAVCERDEACGRFPEVHDARGFDKPLRRVSCVGSNFLGQHCTEVVQDDVAHGSDSGWLLQTLHKSSRQDNHPALPQRVLPACYLDLVGRLHAPLQLQRDRAIEHGEVSRTRRVIVYGDLDGPLFARTLDTQTDPDPRPRGVVVWVG